MMNPGEDAVARSRWLNWLPVLAREERRSLFENFQASGVWNVDFTIMMGLSTALAAFGLLNNSPAAVIRIPAGGRAGRLGRVDGTTVGAPIPFSYLFRLAVRTPGREEVVRTLMVEIVQ